MKVLIACEFSGRVRDALTERGHYAVSCDLLPSLTPGRHVQGDALELAYGDQWDVMIAFPPCTYLTSSNAWRWDTIAPQRAEALEFVRALLNAPIPCIAVENPRGAIGTQIRKADQYVQPWQFGDPYQKMTGLWLKGLDKLEPEVTERPAGVRPWVQAGSYTRAPGVKGSGGVMRKVSERNKTFPGIARAMAEQWGGPERLHSY